MILPEWTAEAVGTGEKAEETGLWKVLDKKGAELKAFGKHRVSLHKVRPLLFSEPGANSSRNEPP